ncbi:MAG: PQQ-binding-like beta-propeller repeat protein [Candidatus Marinimicrobia bacterium]|nr:PQQ-binding-like beta-propeller repeat protein [Candidatus Neomarinimicrobiota bacterium]
MKISLKLMVIGMLVGLTWSCSGMMEDLVAKGAAYQTELDKTGDQRMAEQKARVADSEIGIDRGNIARTGVYPASGIIPKGNLKWRFKLVGDIENKRPSTPIIVKDKVYFSGADDNLYCLDFNKGRKIWMTGHGKDPRGERFTQSPTIVDLYVFAYKRPNIEVGMYHADKGHYVGGLKGKRGLSDFSPVGSPLFIDNKVFIVSHTFNPSIYSFTTNPTDTLWRFQLPGHDIGGGAAYDNGIVYVSSTEGIFAVDAQSGILKWEKQLMHLRGILTPAIANGIVYLPAYVGRVYALDAVTSEVIWTFKPEIENAGNYLLFNNAVTVLDNIVLVSAHEDQYRILDAKTGEELWNIDLRDNENDKNHIVTPASSADGIGYFADDKGKIEAWDLATRERLWTFTVEGSIKSAPAIYKGVVFVSSTDGYIYAIE